MKTLIRTLFVILPMTLLFACSDDSSDPTGPAPDPVLFSWTFEEDLEGWTAETSSIDWGQARWTSNDGGIVQMDGVGNSDPGANGWVSRSIDLPSDATSLRFDTSAHNRNTGTGFLRVRLVDASAASTVLSDWEVMSTGAEGFDWESRELDVSAFAGQTVTLFFEVEDQDGGANNQRYVDNVEIRRD